MCVRAAAFATVAVLTLAGGAVPTRAGITNPDIQINQVGGVAATARGTVGVQNVTPGPGARGVAVPQAPADAGSGRKTNLSQPQTTLDRCDAIRQGRSPPIEGLDCSAGQLDRLRQEAEAETAARPPTTVDVDTLSRGLASPRGASEATDPATGAPAIVILTPGL